MVEFVLHGGGDVVLVQFLDRFGRNPREILRRYWELQEHGVSVVATDEDLSEELMLLLRAGIAGAESRRTSDRVRSNMARAVAKGSHAARAPYGLRRIRTIEGSAVRVAWEQEPAEAEAVRAMYHMAVEQNFGFKRIGDALTAQGIRARGGRPFTSYTVQTVLENPAIVGDLVYGRKPRKGNPASELTTVPDFFPAILTRDEWTRLEARHTIRAESPRGRTHASVYLLSGIARCGHCGGPLVGKVGALRKAKTAEAGERYRNYYCS